MIKGLYEAHLPARNLEASIVFYESLGLKLYKKHDTVAFFWIIEGQSWLGLWEGKEYQTKYHPSLRHIAFQVDLNDLEHAIEWLKEKEFKHGKILEWNLLNQSYFQIKHMLQCTSMIPMAIA